MEGRWRGKKEGLLRYARKSLAIVNRRQGQISWQKKGCNIVRFGFRSERNRGIKDD